MTENEGWENQHLDGSAAHGWIVNIKIFNPKSNSQSSGGGGFPFLHQQLSRVISRLLEIPKAEKQPKHIQNAMHLSPSHVLGHIVSY